MKPLVALLLSMISLSFASAQNLQLQTLLNSDLGETSGLIILDGRLIAHNDSGDDPKLYEIDTATGNVSRTVIVRNATHVDWEDICSDSNYIYVGDIGNNSGSRKDLRIYRISIQDYLQSTSDSVTADTISFEYAEQTDFTPTQFQTNFDAEALLSFGDSLYLFTKNWANQKSNIYAIPKTPGNYSLQSIHEIDPQGLVTGASFNGWTGEVVLTGYLLGTNFTVQFPAVELTAPSPISIYKYLVYPPTGTSLQIESIIPISADVFYLSSEEQPTRPAALSFLTLSSLPVTIEARENSKLSVYPNPTSGTLTYTGTELIALRVIDMKGRRCVYSNSNKIDIAVLPSGHYVLEIILENSTSRILIQRE